MFNVLFINLDDGRAPIVSFPTLSEAEDRANEAAGHALPVLVTPTSACTADENGEW